MPPRFARFLLFFFFCPQNTFLNKFCTAGAREPFCWRKHFQIYDVTSYEALTDRSCRRRSDTARSGQAGGNASRTGSDCGSPAGGDGKAPSPTSVLPSGECQTGSAGTAWFRKSINRSREVSEKTHEPRFKKKKMLTLIAYIGLADESKECLYGRETHRHLHSA